MQDTPQRYLRGMTQPRTPRDFVERNRFGRVGRIPTPTPFPVGDIHSYLILPQAGSASLTLIDTGVKSPEAFEALHRGVKEHGFALEQVERILITHAHPDHFGQARRLREISGAKIFASEIESRLMTDFFLPSANRSRSVVRYFRSWGVPEEQLAPDPRRSKLGRRIQDPVEVDGILAEGDVLDLGDYRLEVFETPGHCDGHVVFYERETRTLFSGDHLLTDISPVPLLSIPEQEGEPRPRSLLRFMDSLDKVEALDCRVTFPSHGDVIWDHRRVIAGYRLHHERRKLQVVRFLGRGPKSPFEVARRMFPKHHRTELYLVMSEVMGHLDVLEEEGLVALEDDGSLVRAHLIGQPDGSPEEEA
jgi:glyoxylase-like metal-dependent hydrolase (beta-lactamase superfamily II)